MLPWPQEKTNFLIKEYPNHGKKWCADKLGMTEGQIRMKAHMLGLRLDQKGEFFLEFQKRAAMGKRGKKYPKISLSIKKRWESGNVYKVYPKERRQPKIIWGTMISRCFNVKNHNFTYYGAKGVSVCDEWRIFDNFYEWYKKTFPIESKERITLDRINSFGNYCPENCRWINYKIQARNKRNSKITQEIVNSIREDFKTITNQRELSRKYGIDYRNIHMILKNKTWN